MIVYLKNGAVIETDDWLASKTRNAVTGELTGIDWLVGGPRRLAYVEIDQVAAIVNNTPKPVAASTEPAP